MMSVSDNCKVVMKWDTMETHSGSSPNVINNPGLFNDSMAFVDY